MFVFYFIFSKWYADNAVYAKLQTLIYNINDNVPEFLILHYTYPCLASSSLTHQVNKSSGAETEAHCTWCISNIYSLTGKLLNFYLSAD